MIRRARLGDRSVDVWLSGGRVAEVVDSGRTSRQFSAHGVTELDAAGGWLLPGIHDHHLHLRALAAARASVAAGPPEVRNARQLASALSRAPGVGPQRWIRAVGYHESVAGELDRTLLDRWVPDRPLRVQHRSGVLWVLNSRGLEVSGADSARSPGIERDGSGRATGRLWRMDEWLSAATPWLDDDDLVATLREVSHQAAASGVTGWTDATPGRSDADATLLADSVARGHVRQRLHLMVRPDSRAPGAHAGERSDRTAAAPGVRGLATSGPVKVILDDFDLPPLESLAETVRAAHGVRRAVAIHCVTRVQIVLALAAIDEAGGPFAGDRIEHGALIPPELIPRLKRGVGMTVVTQPNFVFERGDDYLRGTESEEIGNLWRAGSLAAAGVAVAAGTDAPFGSEDPWAAIRAATARRTSAGVPLGEEERVEPGRAFSWFCGSGAEPARPRRVAQGEPADLLVLGEPLETSIRAAGPPTVVATLVAGEVVYP